jgi:YjbE family integral membrane protein
MDIGTAAFWVALGQIVVADLLLAGDNAVVIALAVRSLPAHLQKRAIVFGTIAAVVFRVMLTLVAARLLTQPYLKLVGAVALLYVAVSLLKPDDESVEIEAGAPAATVAAGATMFTAMRTILIADVVMSLDNVIAVAAASRGDTVLLVLGLLISIPLVVYGSTLLLRLIERFPAIVWAGAALLGFVAGEIAFSDPAIGGWVEAQATALGLTAHRLAQLAGVVGAVVVLLVAWVLVRRATVPPAPH